MMPNAIQAPEKPCFTPGPWQQDGSRIYGPGIQRKLILQVHYSGRGYQEEDTANEKILLAAPEMYNALIAIRDWLLETETLRDPNRVYLEAFVKANNLALDAIAKAEGRNA